ncbi:hypothetical protein KIPE111705_11375 [Kibdelosporangium persicum]|uniref:DUF2567 domain-containing protein n=1 Tax=Kibdelosporangium persicum TaxID=2698649 RepID=A0ABX2EX57_9PSEU|nr:hypothetical protein [Kibdelosporangium persicum]NRN63449.1 hypothetical protein [Kibdelosporangium persicum]
MTYPASWPVARLRQIGSGVWLFAGALAIFGTFMPLLEQSRGPSRPALSVTVWGLEGSQASSANVFPPVGIAVVVGVVMVVVAALLGLTSTRQHPANAPVLAARLIGTGGTGLLLGSLIQIFLFFRVFDQEEADPTFSEFAPTTSTGLGSWLLLASAVLAVAAVVLMLVPKIAKRGQEPDTPPMGIPVVRVLEPEYDEQTPAEQQPTDPKG